MSTAAIAAAVKAAKDRDEEENMTKYNSDDLNGWEFKIVRSDFGRFRNYEIVQKLCKEEARAGWEMVEKFDSSRIRFKRRVENRAQDAHLDFDPYRTSMSSISGAKVAAIIGLIALLAGLATFFAVGYDFEVTDPHRATILVAVVSIVVLAVAIVGLKKRRR